MLYPKKCFRISQFYICLVVLYKIIRLQFFMCILLSVLFYAFVSLPSVSSLWLSKNQSSWNACSRTPTAWVGQPLHSISQFFQTQAGTPEQGCITGHCPHWPLKVGSTGAKVPLHKSITSNFMIYQDRLDKKLLLLFAHIWNSEWISIISVISFEVNIITEHVNAKRMTTVGALLHCTQPKSFELVVRQNHGRPQVVKTGIFHSLEIGAKKHNFLES